MALPGALPGDPDANYGIVFAVTGVAAGTTCVIQRDTSGAFGTAIDLLTCTSNRTVTDILANDGVTRYYRAKLTRVGYADSAWSSAISAAPGPVATAPGT